jgi:hypothetical protein
LTLPDDITYAPGRIEDIRKNVNKAYSEAPENMEALFSTALDQLTDLQYNVSQAFANYFVTPDPTIPQTVSGAVKDAQRIGLGAIRALADRMRDTATYLADHEVPKLQVETTDLVIIKREIDDRFKVAINLHENNDPQALEPMLQVARDYRRYIDQANAKKAGSQAVTTRERRRQLIVYVGGVLSVISIILAIINLLRK